MEKLSSVKPVPGARKVVDHCSVGPFGQSCRNQVGLSLDTHLVIQSSVIQSSDTSSVHISRCTSSDVQFPYLPNKHQDLF